ncbi:nitroreductase family deazaflavin-dependent oxidoreductase [Nocardioides massiliensis]|uniref:Deazaflavin-dependent oxidoreductase (Nitroreductase family) n=1 Tax=Nocardioides massiliensis TaxID=1325935 RepID=A0ABT9NN11_9ACTN|nr:nitroreductase family deazaflavin-dependent oxidoreductase [Nocardioides massiliensis]MDP9821225.1 deazaflavin-dependent oxidoreductase (nitroreductase family) [Nocardioides massiliensis]
MRLLRPVAVWIGSLPWLSRHTALIVRVDKTIQRLTRGRFTLLSLGGIPELFLTVRGRKSGIPRTTPLLCAPTSDGWLVAGSNWGQPKPPVWSLNLEAAGEAEVHFRGRTYVVAARRAEGAERARHWATLRTVWPNYALYEARTDREIPVYVLTRRP